MKDHGRFRSIFESFLQDSDQQLLSDRALRVLVALKLSLPAAGIGIVIDKVMARRCGCTVEQLEAAYAELEGDKPSGQSGWIRREEGVVWLIHGLKFERAIQPTNKKHRRYVAEQLGPIGDFQITRDFRAYYPEWFAGPEGQEAALPKASDHGSPKGHRIASRDGSPIHKTRQDRNSTKQLGGAGKPGSGAGRDGVGRPDPAAAPIDYVVRCVVALNCGMQANPHVPAFIEIPSSSQVGAVSWQEDGIEVDVAEKVIADVCAAFRPNGRGKSIKGLKYFDEPVRARWEELRADGHTRASGRWVPGARNAADNAWLKSQGY